MAEQKETQWVEIPAEEINDVLREGESGIRLTIRMSPHDIPDAVRGRYDEEIEQFVVEFKYIEDEPWKRIQSKDNPITLRVGKHSERLLGLEVDVDAMKAGAIGVQIQPDLMAEQMAVAIDSFARTESRRRPRSESRRRSYSVAKKALASQKDKIFRPLPA